MNLLAPLQLMWAHPVLYAEDQEAKRRAADLAAGVRTSEESEEGGEEAEEEVGAEVGAESSGSGGGAGGGGGRGSMARSGDGGMDAAVSVCDSSDDVSSARVVYLSWRM